MMIIVFRWTAPGRGNPLPSSLSFSPSLLLLLYSFSPIDAHPLCTNLPLLSISILTRERKNRREGRIIGGHRGAAKSGGCHGPDPYSSIVPLYLGAFHLPWPDVQSFSCTVGHSSLSLSPPPLLPPLGPVCGPLCPQPLLPSPLSSHLSPTSDTHTYPPTLPSLTLLIHTITHEPCISPLTLFTCTCPLAIIRSPHTYPERVCVCTCARPHRPCNSDEPDKCQLPSPTISQVRATRQAPYPPIWLNRVSSLTTTPHQIPLSTLPPPPLTLTMAGYSGWTDILQGEKTPSSHISLLSTFFHRSPQGSIVSHPHRAADETPTYALLPTSIHVPACSHTHTHTLTYTHQGTHTLFLLSHLLPASYPTRPIGKLQQ